MPPDVPSNRSEEPADSERDRSDQTADQSELSTSTPPSHAERLRAWMVTNALAVEMSLAAGAVVVWILALPIVIFGSFTALGGDTTILTTGLAIAAVGLFLIFVLSVWSLAQVLIEVRTEGVPFSDGRNTTSVAYDGIQTVKAIIAGVFLFASLAYLVSVLTVDSGPGEIIQLLVVSGLSFPVIVFVHAVGSVFGSG